MAMKALTYSDIREVVTIATDFRLWYEDVGQEVELTINRLYEYLDHEYPLYAKVASLDKLALQELCALMWIGRGDSFPASDWHEAVDYASTAVPGYIVEKYPLVEYLTDGLKELGYYSEFSFEVNQFKERQRKYKDIIQVADISRELYEYLKKQPDKLYEFPSRRFEELVADILENSGFEVHLTQETRDGGRDIIAFYPTPIAKLMTIVECKRYAKERKIGIDVVERFLYVVDRKDDASMGMIVTTSYFTKDAKEIERARPYRLSLKDFDDIQEWISIEGNKYEKNGAGIWLPIAA